MTEHTYHFISGLPRSGSNLLGAMLIQNPEVHTGMTTPVMNMVTMLTEAMRHNEDRVWFDEKRRFQLIKGLFDNYYYDVEQKIIFDTNRFWPSYMNILKLLFPDFKMIACVRNVEWVMDSLELAYQRNKFRSSAFDFPRALYDRCTLNASQEGPVGRAMHALREGVYGPNRDRIMLIQYESITDSPQYVLDKVYNFINVPRYRHHYFSDLKWNAGDKYDEHQGLPDLHRVRPVVKRENRQTILPPDLFELYKQYNFWKEQDFLPKEVNIV